MTIIQIALVYIYLLPNSVLVAVDRFITHSKNPHSYATYVHIYVSALFALQGVPYQRGVINYPPGYTYRRLQ